MQEKKLPVLQKVIDAVCNHFIEASCKQADKSFDFIQKCVRFLGKILRFLYISIAGVALFIYTELSHPAFKPRCEISHYNTNHCKSSFIFLVNIYNQEQAQNIQFSSGLVLDWLEILDPEIVHVDPLLQRELLFMDRNEVVSHKGVDRSKTPASYLRALLAHQTKGNALHDCLDWLLGVDPISARFVMTFIVQLVGIEPTSHWLETVDTRYTRSWTMMN